MIYDNFSQKCTNLSLHVYEYSQYTVVDCFKIVYMWCHQARLIWNELIRLKCKVLVMTKPQESEV